MTTSAIALATAASLLVASLAPSAAPAARLNRSLRLLRGAGACLSLFRVAGCRRAAGFSNPLQGSAISADGSSIYLPSENDSYIGGLRRDPRSGRLTQATNPLACWKGRLATGDPHVDPFPAPCQSARGFGEVTRWVAVARDGRTVYVASGPRDLGFGPDQTEAVAVFARDPSTGALTQPRGPDACVASAPLDGCTVLPGLTAQSISVSPDSRHVYAAGARLTVFARDPGSGALTPQSCLSAIATPTCPRTPLSLPVHAPAFTATGRFAYALAEHPPTGDPPPTPRPCSLSRSTPPPGPCRPSPAPGDAPPPTAPWPRRAPSIPASERP